MRRGASFLPYLLSGLTPRVQAGDDPCFLRQQPFRMEGQPALLLDTPFLLVNCSGFIPEG